MFRFSPDFYHAQGDAPAGTPAPAAAAAAQGQQTDMAGVVQETLRLQAEAAEKKGRGIARSMAEQSGLTEEQLNAAIRDYQARNKAPLPEDAQKQIDAANARLVQYQLAAAITKEGAALGLVDPDLAAQLIKDDIMMNDQGELTGVKEALEKLREGKPYLFGAAAKPAAMAQRVGGRPAGTMDGVEARFYARNPGIKPQS